MAADKSVIKYVDYTETKEYKEYMFRKEQKAKVEWLKSQGMSTNVEWDADKYHMIKSARTRGM